MYGIEISTGISKSIKEYKDLKDKATYGYINSI